MHTRTPLAAPTLPGTCPAQLRPLAASDAPAWSAYLALPAVIEHTSWGDVSVPALARLIEGYTDASHCRRWALVDLHGQLLGTVGLNDIDALHGRAELAYDLAPASQGRGLATEAAAAVIEWAQQHAGLQRIQATVLDSNHASIAVLERLCLQREGLLQAYRRVRGQPRDFWMYARIAALAPPPG